MKSSCNGCRVLRKGCNENCIIKPCLEWISCPEAQGNVTLFLAKFYGRTGLLNLLANATNKNSIAVFKSLLYEAAGRLVNPTHGALGLFRTGEWSRCEAAVEAVLTGSNINVVDGQTSSSSSCTNIAEKRVLQSIARGTNMGIKEKTEFKRVGSTSNPKSQIGLVNKATLLKAVLENDRIKAAAQNGATQVNLELTLGFNFQSNNDNKSDDN